MPPRSNDFQEFVAMLTRLLGDGAHVEESKMLVDLVSGDKREVDICAERTVAGHTVLVSVECRDHERKQGVEWVEQMRAKHDRLPTNALVLVSSSGFTKSSLALARTYGIKTITPQQATPEFVDAIFDKANGWPTTVWEWDIENMRLLLDTLDESLRPVESEETINFYKADGSLLVSGADYRESVLRGVPPIVDVPGPRVERDFEVLLWAPSMDDQPLHVLLTSETGEESFVWVKRIRLQGKARPHEAVMPLEFGSYDGAEFVSGDLTVSDSRLRLVIGRDPQAGTSRLEYRVERRRPKKPRGKRR